MFPHVGPMVVDRAAKAFLSSLEKGRLSSIPYRWILLVQRILLTKRLSRAYTLMDF